MRPSLITGITISTDGTLVPGMVEITMIHLFRHGTALTMEVIMTPGAARGATHIFVPDGQVRLATIGATLGTMDGV